MSLTKATYSMISGAPVNILDFGASPSATPAANAVAIQAAINSVSATGGCVVIPSGNFQYDTTLNMGNSIELLGVSQEASILTYTGTGNGIQTDRPCFMPKIRNFSLLCNNASNSGIGIQWGHIVRRGVIEDMLVRYFGLKGIELCGGLINIVRHCSVFNNNINQAAASVGIHVRPIINGSPGVPVGDAPTTITLEKNYISTQTNTAGNSTGIRWDNAYMCYDIDNTTEVCNIAREVGRDLTLSPQVPRLAIVNPYFEVVTTELVWTDAEGYYIQGNGTVDPNTVANWGSGVIPAGFRYVWYQNNPASSGNNFSQFGSINVNGVSKTTATFATGIVDRGDTGYTWDPFSAEVNIAAPVLTNRVATLPTAVGIAGWKTTIVKSNNINTLTVTPNGSQTISGAASYVLNNTGEHVTVISDGANWFVIGSGGIKQPAVPDGSSVNTVLAALRNYGIIAQ